MRLVTTSVLLAAFFTACARAEIVPSWRINPIAPGGPADAISVSLVVDATLNSAFESAGLALTQAQFPGIESISPTTLNGTAMQPFDPGLPLSTGANGLFNAIWSPPPPLPVNTFNLEIARFTVRNVAIGSTDVDGFAMGASEAPVGLPPIPIRAVPEPVGAMMVAVTGLVALRQRGRC